MNETNGIAYAKAVDIQEVIIISRTGIEYDIKNLVAEINIFEALDSPVLTGNVLISDGVDLINEIPIVGEELIRIRIQTPTFNDDEIFYKTFKVCALGDKAPALTDRTQVFTLHFISQEGFLDSIAQISGTFSGNVSDVVTDLYNRFLSMPRNIVDGVESRNNTELTVLDNTKNTITFTSPNWSPIKCINYVTSRSLRSDNDGSNFVFFESNKGFIYGSIQELIAMQLKQGFIFEHYIYSPTNVQIPDPNSNFKYKKPNLDRSYRLAEDFSTEEDFNLLNSNNIGHLSNKVITFDLIHKRVSTLNYDYLDNWNKYIHVDFNDTLKSGKPITTDKQIRSSNACIITQPQHPFMYNDIKETTTDNIAKILSSRTSMMADINSRKVYITVPGRTDVECAMLISFSMPAFKNKDVEMQESEALDKFYSGLYLISAIRHKMTNSAHVMRLELVRDSVSQ